MEQALIHIRWYQFVHQSVYGKPKGIKEVRTMTSKPVVLSHTRQINITIQKAKNTLFTSHGRTDSNKINLPHQVQPTVKNQGYNHWKKDSRKYK